MAQRQASGYKQKGYWGRGLALAGLAALVFDLGFVVGPVVNLVEKSKAGIAGVGSTVGLSFLDAARALAFHQVDYLSLVFRILVLFLALTAVIVGAVLLGSRSARTTGEDLLGSSEIHQRETE